MKVIKCRGDKITMIKIKIIQIKMIRDIIGTVVREIRVIGIMITGDILIKDICDKNKGD